jgi:hypothetical protein
MKRRFWVALLLFAVAGSACSYLPFQGNPQDCGYFASFDLPKEGEGAWISISLVVAERVNGEINCGFGHVPTRAERVSVNGTELRIITIGEDVLYVAPADFDPNTQELKVEIDGWTYTSVPRELRREGKRFSLPLHRSQN